MGDSISQVNPLVGEGYRFILNSANFASEAISKALKNSDYDLLHEYEENWKAKYLKGYRASKKVQILLDKLGKSDLLVDAGMLFLKTKRDKTVERILAGGFGKKEFLLP